MAIGGISGITGARSAAAQNDISNVLKNVNNDRIGLLNKIAKISVEDKVSTPKQIAQQNAINELGGSIDVSA